MTEAAHDDGATGPVALGGTPWRGTDVEARSGDDRLAGTFLGVDACGRALVATGTGTRAWSAGEVRAVRQRPEL